MGTGETYGLRKGDRVCFIGPGAYAEYTAAPALHAFKVPDSISDQTAAGAYMQGLAAISIMSEAYDAKRGDWALVHAAAGGVGLWLCQLLARQGVNVIGTASSEVKQRLALEHGARAVVNYKQDDIVRKVQEVTQGEGVDVVFDGVGRDTLSTDLAVLRRKGTLIMHGTASGDPKDFKIGWLTPKNIKFLKPTFMNYLATRDEVNRYATELFDALSNNSVTVHISKEYPLQDVHRAHKVSADIHPSRTQQDRDTDRVQAIESRGTMGKLLLKL